LNPDIGEIFKNLFAKKGTDRTKGILVNPLMKTFFVGGIAVVFIILYVFFIYLPIAEENRLKQEKISQVKFLQSEINTISGDIVKATKDLSDANAEYQRLTKLFHTGKELDDLYRHISMLAYYEFKVRFEISGNYADYTSFRKGLAQLKKIININQEEIIVLQSETKKGEVKVTAVLAIYRIPTESEKYVNSEEVLQ